MLYQPLKGAFNILTTNVMFPSNSIHFWDEYHSGEWINMKFLLMICMNYYKNGIFRTNIGQDYG